MLKYIRQGLAIVGISTLTLLFLDVTGLMHNWFEFISTIQFIPALLAVNFAAIFLVISLTFVFGRIYCSVLCPLGIFQDLVIRLKNKLGKNNFKYSKPIKYLRYIIMVVFAVALFSGFANYASIIEPYSVYGRIATNLFAPVYTYSNNILASFAEQYDSYIFYSADLHIINIVPLIIAALSLIILTITAWSDGRIYCNTVCPVGSFLGILSRYSLLKPVINKSSCTNCGLCEKGCKASCIDSKSQQIDLSRCVTCMNCIEDCSQNAISYAISKKDKGTEIVNNNYSYRESNKDVNTRRNILTFVALFSLTGIFKSKAAEKVGGLAPLQEKKAPKRKTLISPPGSNSYDNITKHCTGCQKCVTACPHKVLRSSESFDDLLKPIMSFEYGYCRPECTLCSEVCPTGAINEITKAEKTSIQIGYAVWNKHTCIVNTDKVSCGNCARHCPVNAIIMIAKDANDPKSLKIPAIDSERCIGCGACEYLCPVNPFSAIKVEGNEIHHKI